MYQAIKKKTFVDKFKSIFTKAKKVGNNTILSEWTKLAKAYLSANTNTNRKAILKALEAGKSYEELTNGEKNTFSVLEREIAQLAYSKNTKRSSRKYIDESKFTISERVEIKKQFNEALYKSGHATLDDFVAIVDNKVYIVDGDTKQRKIFLFKECLDSESAKLIKEKLNYAIERDGGFCPKKYRANGGLGDIGSMFEGEFSEDISTDIQKSKHITRRTSDGTKLERAELSEKRVKPFKIGKGKKIYYAESNGDIVTVSIGENTDGKYKVTYSKGKEVFATEEVSYKALKSKLSSRTNISNKLSDVKKVLNKPTDKSLFVSIDKNPNNVIKKTKYNIEGTYTINKGNGNERKVQVSRVLDKFELKDGDHIDTYAIAKEVEKALQKMNAVGRKGNQI